MRGFIFLLFFLKRIRSSFPPGSLSAASPAPALAPSPPPRLPARTGAATRRRASSHSPLAARRRRGEGAGCPDARQRGRESGCSAPLAGCGGRASAAPAAPISEKRLKFQPLPPHAAVSISPISSCRRCRSLPP